MAYQRKMGAAAGAEESDEGVQGPDSESPGLEDAAAHGGKKGMKRRGKVAALILMFKGKGNKLTKNPAGAPLKQPQRD